jgi:hypothetical protein
MSQTTQVSDLRVSLCENDRFQKRSYSACLQDVKDLYKNSGTEISSGDTGLGVGGSLMTQSDSFRKIQMHLIFKTGHGRFANYFLKVHKIENFFDSDFGICVISLLVIHK